MDVKQQSVLPCTTNRQYIKDTCFVRSGYLEEEREYASLALQAQYRFRIRFVRRELAHILNRLRVLSRTPSSWRAPSSSPHKNSSSAGERTMSTFLSHKIRSSPLAHFASRLARPGLLARCPCSLSSPLLRYKTIVAARSRVRLLCLVLGRGLEPPCLAALGPKPSTSTNFATPASVHYNANSVVRLPGLEPGTVSLRGSCSTN